VASAAALTINNQLKVATAAATETAMMTAMTMTMETKMTAASCGGKGNPAVTPIWRHYDANNTLLGIFALAYFGNGDVCIAYAVRRRFVEGELHERIGGMMSPAELLGGTMTVMSTSPSLSSTFSRAGGADNDYNATIKRLAIKAHRWFEEALLDKVVGRDNNGGRGGQGKGRASVITNAQQRLLLMFH
jgi:hypothetical protein